MNFAILGSVLQKSMAELRDSVAVQRSFALRILSHSAATKVLAEPMSGSCQSPKRCTGELLLHKYVVGIVGGNGKDGHVSLSERIKE
jgi:hypothetical protein